MANFTPLKNYIFFCLDQLMKEQMISSPFLDVGCGIGDLSKYLANKGLFGSAIDISEGAIEQAKQTLAKTPQIRVEKKSFFEENRQFNTVIMLDVLEHLEDDEEALKKIASLLPEGGQAIFTVPSNPVTWGWDDDYYGHIRRYTAKGMRKKLRDAGFECVVFWDFTYPVFTWLRQLHLRFFSKPERFQDAIGDQTKASGLKPEWQSSWTVKLLSGMHLVWNLVYQWQFRFYRNKLRKGHEMLVLVKKLEMAGP